jgi:hypothetical protein
MVQKMNNEDYLFKIYHYIIPKFNKENKKPAMISPASYF